MNSDFEDYFTFPQSQVEQVEWLELKYEMSPSNTTQLRNWEKVYEANTLAKPVRPDKSEWYGVKDTKNKPPKERY